MYNIYNVNIHNNLICTRIMYRNKVYTLNLKAIHERYHGVYTSICGIKKSNIDGSIHYT